MPLSNPVTLYGIHSATFYNRSDRKPIAYMRVLGDANLELTGETEDLYGGSSMYMWDSEAKQISSEVSFTCREYPIEAMNLLLAGQVTSYTAVSGGQIVDAANVNGSLIGADGIASIAISAVSGEVPKEGDYVVVGVADNKVDVYAMSDVDFGASSYLDDALKIKSGLSITTSGTTEVVGFGFKFIGGADTDGISITAGDSAKFTVRRSLVTGVKMVVGQAGSSFDEFGCILTGQKSGSGSIAYMDIYRCKALGMPISFKEKGYSEWSLTIKALYDSEKNGVFTFIRNG